MGTTFPCHEPIKYDKGVFDRLKDTIRYEQLKEVVRMNPEWNNEEMARDLSKRIRNRTEL